MKLFLGIVTIIVFLGAAIWLMAPRDGARSGGAPVAAGGAGSKATDDKITTISKGDKVVLEEHLKDGRFTIVEFTADW